MKTETSSQSAYSKFIEQVNSDEVQQVTIKPDRIEYILKPEFCSQRYSPLIALPTLLLPIAESP